jgi:protoheme IX farnesyltransferase
VLSLERQPTLTRVTIAISSLVLVPVSLSLPLLGVAGVIYTVAATILGLLFVAIAARGLRLRADGDHAERARRWARGLFLYSLLYLVALFGALALDRVVSAG